MTKDEWDKVAIAKCEAIDEALTILYNLYPRNNKITKRVLVCEQKIKEVRGIIDDRVN